MGNKVFVGGLSFDIQDDGLREGFARFGEITEAKVITDRTTGQSRGFGFITFANEDSVSSAIAEMNGTEMGGRTIRVSEAQENSGRGGGRGGRGGRGGFGGGGRGGYGGGGRSGYGGGGRGGPGGGGGRGGYGGGGRGRGGRSGGGPSGPSGAGGPGGGRW
ncbi:MAG: RNA-binding protein [Deltaproteobacteria bacterium]|nr:RNA-binding protein [Deltaproteobacteria bacterium]